MNRSIARAAQILAYFAGASRPAGISEISRALGIPKASASDCLYTLAQTGLLQLADPQRKTFALGPAGAQLGYAAMREFGAVRLGRDELDTLCRTFGHTAFLAAPSGDHIVIADKAEPASSAHLSIRIGETLDWHLTAAGKAMLAAMTDAQVADLIGPACYHTHTSASISCYPYLIRELARIREQGFACENFENSSTVYGLAAPVYDCCNRVCAALSVIIPKSSLPACSTDAIARALTASAMRLSVRLDSTLSTPYSKE